MELISESNSLKVSVKKRSKENMPLSDPSKKVLGGPGRQKEGHVTHTGYEAQPALTCSVALEEFKVHRLAQTLSRSPSALCQL